MATRTMVASVQESRLACRASIATPNIIVSRIVRVERMAGRPEAQADPRERRHEHGPLDQDAYARRVAQAIFESTLVNFTVLSSKS